MKRVTKPMMISLIEELRSLAPKRPLTYGESIQLARMQAARLRRWLGAEEPDINLVWLLQQRAVPFTLAPSYKLNEQSGLTTNAVDKKLQVFINQNEPHGRCSPRR